jgi:hypothetical protein
MTVFTVVVIDILLVLRAGRFGRSIRRSADHDAETLSATGCKKGALRHMIDYKA